jgi:hypothetical protein
MTDVFQHTLVHPVGSKGPSLPFGTQDAEWSPQKIATSRRLIAAYKATVLQENSIRLIADNDLWSWLIQETLAKC